MSAPRLLTVTNEPVSVSDAKLQAQIDGANAEPAPGAITGVALISPAAAGNVDNGAHRYLATFVTADGETEAGSISAAVTVADKSVNGKVALTGIPLGGDLVTARKLYRTAAGGGTYLLLATLADNTTTVYTDNIADASLGAQAPTSNTTEDPTLVRIIAACRAMAEQECNRSFATKTWQLALDSFPPEIELPWPPLIAVSSITYVDPDGNTQTLDSSDYSVDAKSEPGWILPAVDVAWPATQDVANAVLVNYSTGYSDAALVPPGVKLWILAQVRHFWNNRGGTVTRDGAVENPYLRSLLDSARVYA